MKSIRNMYNGYIVSTPFLLKNKPYDLRSWREGAHEDNENMGQL